MPRVAKFIETENITDIMARGRIERGVSVWDDKKKILEIDSGDIYTTLWIQLMPLNCTLKMTKQINKKNKVSCCSQNGIKLTTSKDRK